jgi:hypothetical protein
MPNMIGENNTNIDASPASTDSRPAADTPASPASDGPVSARDWLTERVRSRETKPQRAVKDVVAKSTEAVAGPAEDASETDDSQSSAAPEKKEEGKTEPKDTLHPKFQKRIDRLTAKYHETQRAVAERDVQVQKLQKAAEILQAELARVTKRANLDPNEEKMTAMQYERDVEKFVQGLDKQTDELYNKGVSEYQVQARADEILDEVNELVQQYDLVSPEEVLLAMRDRGMTAAAAARSIHSDRLARAAKRTAVQHPATTARTGSGGTNPPDAPYRGADSIRDFLKSKMAQRTGRSE